MKSTKEIAERSCEMECLTLNGAVPQEIVLEVVVEMTHRTYHNISMPPPLLDFRLLTDTITSFSCLRIVILARRNTVLACFVTTISIIMDSQVIQKKKRF
jgi:hypothetical protein